MPEDQGESACWILERRQEALRHPSPTLGALIVSDLLDRLKEAGMRMVDVFVESRDTRTIAAADRRVILNGLSYPLTITGPNALRKIISAAQARVGRAPGARGGEGGGNQNKRLRIFIEGDRLQSVAELGNFLETGT